MGLHEARVRSTLECGDSTPLDTRDVAAPRPSAGSTGKRRWSSCANARNSAEPAPNATTATSPTRKTAPVSDRDCLCFPLVCIGPCSGEPLKTAASDDQYNIVVDTGVGVMIDWVVRSDDPCSISFTSSQLHLVTNNGKSCTITFGRTGRVAVSCGGGGGCALAGGGAGGRGGRGR